MSDELTQAEQEANDLWAEAAELVAKTEKQAVYLARLGNLHTVLDANRSAVEVLWEEVVRRREHYVRQEVHRQINSGAPVDQRKIDFMRGVWHGARLALLELPREAKQAHEKLQKGLDDETKEATA